MKKTMIYLDEEQHYLLCKRAKSSRTSIAKLIREAVKEYITRTMERDVYFSFVGIAEGPEKGRVSEDVNSYLREALK